MSNDSDLLGKSPEGVRGPKGPPPHPGTILSRFTIPRLSMTKHDVAKLTGIGDDRLDLLLAGELTFDEEVREAFRPVLGTGADSLYAVQRAFDFYAETGEIPPPGTPPKRAQKAGFSPVRSRRTAP